MQQVVLVACGAFNPPTLAHLRMMEMAKEHMNLLGYEVVGGYISPVNDVYGKPGLIPAKHRLEMVRLTIEDANWLYVDDWEALLSEWTPTAQVLQKIANQTTENTRVMLVAGSDICKSFNIAGLWDDNDLECICSAEHGLILIERISYEESYAEVFKNHALFKNQANIYFIHQPVKSNLSSTKVRMLCRIGAGIKYLVPSKVEDYIRQHSFYKE